MQKTQRGADARGPAAPRCRPCRYLNHNSLDCYWLMLLQEWSKLLRFDPWEHFNKLGEEFPAMWKPQPVHQWLQMVKASSEAMAKQVGHGDYTFWVEPSELEFEDDVDISQAQAGGW